MAGQWISTKIVIDIETGRVLEREGFFYNGPVALAKKGREQADAAAKGGVALGKQGSQIATQDQGIQQGYRTAGDTAAKTYFAPPTDPSGLNQFNRNDAYVRALQNQQQLGLAGIGYNGFINVSSCALANAA